VKEREKERERDGEVSEKERERDIEKEREKDRERERPDEKHWSQWSHRQDCPAGVPQIQPLLAEPLHSIVCVP